MNWIPYGGHNSECSEGIFLEMMHIMPNGIGKDLICSEHEYNCTCSGPTVSAEACRPGPYNPTLSKERKDTIRRIFENRSLYGIPEIKKIGFFEKVERWLKTKWKFDIKFTITKIPPVDLRAAHWPDEVVKEMLKMDRVPIEFNEVGGKING